MLKYTLWLLQVTGYRHDVATREFVHALDAIMTAVALDENNRPYRGLPELVDPSNGSRILHLQEVARQRKDLSIRLKKMEATGRQIPPSSTVPLDMLEGAGEWTKQVSVKDTEVALAASFLPRHLNRNGTVFGGEILSWMVRGA